jgi:hypothetical protein
MTATLENLLSFEKNYGETVRGFPAHFNDLDNVKNYGLGKKLMSSREVNSKMQCKFLKKLGNLLSSRC